MSFSKSTVSVYDFIILVNVDNGLTAILIMKQNGSQIRRLTVSGNVFSIGYESPDSN